MSGRVAYTIYHPGDGKLRSAATRCWPGRLNRDLMELDNQEVYRVWGLIPTQPRSCRASHQYAYFYINGALCRNRTMMAAMKQRSEAPMRGKFLEESCFWKCR